MTRYIAFIAVLGVVVAILPDASAYPFPTVIGSSMRSIGSYMRALNELLPIDVLLHLLVYAVIIRATTRVVYPLVLKIITKLTMAKPGS